MMRAAMRYAGRKVQEGHRSAIPLRDTILGAGGVPLAAEWIHPADLVAIGLAAAQKDAAGARA